MHKNKLLFLCKIYIDVNVFYDSINSPKKRNGTTPELKETVISERRGARGERPEIKQETTQNNAKVRRFCFHNGKTATGKRL